MNNALYIILFFLFTTCKSFGGSESELIVKFLNNEEICISPYNGEKECLDLKSKKIFVLQYLDTLHSELYLSTNQKEFTTLANSYESLNQIDSLSGQKLYTGFYDGLEFELTDDVNKADIKLSITPFFKLNKFTYCIVQISEGMYKKWIIKVKMKEGKIIASEVTQILD